MIGKTNANITINNSSSGGSSSENQYVPQEPAGYEINTKVFGYSDYFEDKYKYNFTTKQFYPVEWNEIEMSKAPLIAKQYLFADQNGYQDYRCQRLYNANTTDNYGNFKDTIYTSITSIPKTFGDGKIFYENGFDINSPLKCLFSLKFIYGTITGEFGSLDNDYITIRLHTDTLEIKKEGGKWNYNNLEYIADNWQEKILQNDNYLYLYVYTKYYVIPKYNEQVNKIKWEHFDVENNQEETRNYKVKRVTQAFLYDKDKNLIAKSKFKIVDNGEFNVYYLDLNENNQEELKINYSIYCNNDIYTEYDYQSKTQKFDLLNTSYKVNETLYPVFTDTNITKDMESVPDYETFETENKNYTYGTTVNKSTFADYFLNNDGNINHTGEEYNDFITSIVSLTYELNKTYTTHFVFSFDQTKDNDGNELNYYDRSGNLFESRVYNKDFHRSWNDEQQKDMIKLQDEEIYLEYNKKYVIELSLTPTHIDTSNGRQELKIKSKWILKDYTTNESLYIYTNEDRDYDSYDLDSDDYNKAPFGFAIIPYKNLTIYGTETYFAIDGEKKYLVVEK